jgi:phospholipid/cholesterol/gamma-HCH transport system ATP-binding protein
MATDKPIPSRQAAGEPAIRVEHLSKRFGGHQVLTDVSLEVMPGETMVIMGGSGSGKSTLLRCMIGSIQPDAGAIRMFGQDITEIGEEQFDEFRRKFGILFQSGALFNSMTVGDNVALPLRLHTHLDEEIIELQVKIKLEMVGLRDFADLMPAMLSGGMKKRVALARAIALDPKILFYDEPSAGLDPITSGVIDKLISDLARNLGVTSVVVTHEMDSAFAVADRMAMLHEGRIIKIGPAAEFRDSSDPLVRQFVSGAPDGPIPLRRNKTDYVKDILGTLDEPP